MAYTKHVRTSGTGYGQANGIRMAFGQHLPPANPNGRKHQLWIWLHGIEAIGPRPTSNTDYGTLDIVANKGMPSLIKTVSALPMVRLPGGSEADDFGIAMLFPQCSSEFATWPFAYTAEMIKHAQQNLADVVDVDRIHLCGYSFGGGGVFSITKDEFVNRNIATFHAIAGGYNATPNYTYVSNSGARIFVYHSAGDTTTIDGGTGNGAYVSRTFVTNLNNTSPKPMWPVQFFEFVDLTHDSVLPPMVEATPSNQSLALTNGQFFVTNETIYQRSCPYTRHKRTRFT